MREAIYTFKSSCRENAVDDIGRHAVEVILDEKNLVDVVVLAPLERIVRRVDYQRAHDSVPTMASMVRDDSLMR